MRDIAAKVQDATPCQLAGKVMEAVNKNCSFKLGAPAMLHQHGEGCKNSYFYLVPPIYPQQERHVGLQRIKTYISYLHIGFIFLASPCISGNTI